VIQVRSVWASSWMCWRCGGSHGGDDEMFQVTITDAEGNWRTSACMCRGCAGGRDPNGGFSWALPIIGAICNGRQVWWKLRLRLAWRILRGTLQ
jgi:hypothetical protein